MRVSLRRRWWWALVAALVAAASLAGVEASAGPSAYPVLARFARAPGLFPGAAVEVLGVPVGTVTSVSNVDDEVAVGLAIERGHPVPASVTASLVAPELLGEPSIELSPGYTGGPVLRPGAVIPMSRTAVPVSTEQVLKALRTTLERIDPHAVGDLVTNLAQDLSGQGKDLRRLISGAAGTLQLLATKARTLGQLNGSLAQLTGVLDARTGQITQLITDYDTVSGVISAHGAQLGSSLVQFSKASSELVQLLTPNLAPLESDVGVVTNVGRTLDRNLTSVDEILSSAVALFTGARRVYTSTYNW
ncbi:MAG: MCE family protein, partial [Acidimicrobiales bacterium]